MLREKVPSYVLANMNCTTQQRYRQLKRKQLREAIKAMDALLRGCAWAPRIEGVYIGNMYRQLNQLKSRWSQKEWGK